MRIDKHLLDNYYQIFLSISNVTEIINSSLDGLRRNREAFVNTEKDSDEWKIIEDVEDFKVEEGKQYLSYTYIILLAATIEKNIKLLKTDGFIIKNKYKIFSECQKNGIENNDYESLVFDLFVLRNLIAHSLANTVINKKSKKDIEKIILKYNLTTNYTDELIIDKSIIDEIAIELDKLFKSIATFVYEVDKSS